MLKNKDIKKLKALANKSNHKYQIGKNKIDNNVIKLINDALKAHELIKIYFNKNIASEIDTLSEIIIKATDSNMVNIIGHCLIIYKENKEKKDKIVL